MFIESAHTKLYPVLKLSLAFFFRACVGTDLPLICNISAHEGHVMKLTCLSVAFSFLGSLYSFLAHLNDTSKRYPVTSSTFFPEHAWEPNLWILNICFLQSLFSFMLKKPEFCHPSRINSAFHKSKLLVLVQSLTKL